MKKTLLIGIITILLIINLTNAIDVTSYYLYDEFEGSNLNTSIWTSGAPWSVGGNSTGSNTGELQCYTTENINISNGSIKLYAKQENITNCGDSGRNFSYTSGAFNSYNKSFINLNKTNTVYFEAKMKLNYPVANSLWPAFWLTNQNDTSYPWPPEVDIFEAFGNLNESTSALWYYPSGADVMMSGGSGCGWLNLSNYHVWTLKVNSTNIEGLIDNVSCWNQTNASKVQQIVGAWNHTFLRFNLAVGGFSNSSIRINTTVGQTFPTSPFEIDYVKVYKIDTVNINLLNPLTGTISNGSQYFNLSANIGFNSFDSLQVSANSQYNFTIMDNNTQMYLPLDNNSVIGENNTRIVDISKNNYSINISGNPTINTTGCVFDQCWRMDGVDDRFVVNQFPKLNSSYGDYTIEAWTTIYNRSNANFNIIATLYSQFNSGARNGTALEFINQSDGTYKISLVVANASMSTSFTSTQNFSFGELHHFALTKKGEFFSLYADGILLGYKQVSFAFDNIDPFLIGSYFQSSTGSGNMTIDNFIFTNRSKSYFEISQAYSLKRTNSTNYLLNSTIRGLYGQNTYRLILNKQTNDSIQYNSSSINYLINESFTGGNYNRSFWTNQTLTTYSMTFPSTTYQVAPNSMLVDSRCTDSLVNSSLRSEILSAAFIEGEEYWIGLSLKIPDNFTNDPGIPPFAGQIFFQLHATEDAGDAGISPPIALAIYNDQINFSVRNSSLQNTTSNLNTSEVMYSMGNASKGEWMRFILNLKMDSGEDGFVRVWRNHTLIVNRTGFVGFNDSIGGYPKFGIYWGNNSGAYCNKTLYHDDILIGDVFSSFKSMDIQDCLLNRNCYISQSTGLDSNPGTLEEPWQTINRAKNLSLISNNTLLLKRGDIWREPLSVNASNFTVKSYGSGDRPKVWASVNCSSASDWMSLGGNKYSTTCATYQAATIWYNVSGEAQAGNRRTHEADLTSNYDYYWNTTQSKLIVYSSLGNPGTTWNQIEIPQNYSTTGGWEHFWLINQVSNVIIDGLEFAFSNRGSTDGGALVAWLSNGTNISNNNFKYTYEKGLIFDASNNVVARNNSFFRVGQKGATNGQNSQGENIWISSARNATIANNTLNHTSNVGINFYRSQNLLAEGNIISEYERYNTSQGGTGIYYDACNNSITRNNYLKDCGIALQVNAEALGDYSVNNTFYNNVVDSCMSGFWVNNEQSAQNILNTNISHNTFFTDTLFSGFSYQLFLKYYNNITFKDNIISQTYTNTSGYLETQANGSGNFNQDYNLFYSAANRGFQSNGTDKTFATWQSLGYDANSLNVLPLMDLALQPYANSPACGSASDGGDMGALTCSLTEFSTNQSAPSQAQALEISVTYIRFNWSVNNNTYYNRTTLLIDNVEIANYTTTTTNYNMTGLTQNTAYLITLRNYDSFGFSNETNTTLTTQPKIWLNNTLIYFIDQNVSSQPYNNNTWSTHWQTFKPNTTTISNVTIPLMKSSGNLTADSVTLYIRTSTNTTIGIVNATHTFNGSYKEISFDFTTPINVTIGQTYYLTLESNDASLKVIRQNNVYPDGQYWEGTSYDMIFKTWYSNSTTYSTYILNTPNNNSGLTSGNNHIITTNTTVTDSNTTIRLYNNLGVLQNSINQNSQIVNLTFNLNTTGTYYFNGTTENETHITYLETRQFTLYTGNIDILTPTNNTPVNNTLPINWSLNTTEISLNISYTQITIDDLLINNVSGNNTRNYNWTNIYNWNLTRGTHNLTVLARLTDLNTINTTHAINITANTLLNITAKNIINNTNFNTFNGWLYNYETQENQTFTATTGFLNINATRGNLTIYLNSTEAISITSINYTNISTPSANITFYLTPISIPLTFSPTLSQTCLAGYSSLTNFTVKEEINMTNINATINYNFYFLINNSYNATHIYGTINNTNIFSICLNSTLFPNWQINDGEIEYTTTDYVTRRYYIFNNTRLSNETNNITLYNIPEADQTSFKLTIESNSLASYDNRYTTLIRWYPGSNQYNVVDMGKTDTNGETVIHVEIEDVDYRIGVYENNGSLIYLASPIRMVCLTSPCTYTLKIPNEAGDYTSFEQVETSITYNKTTGIFTFIWNDPSQTTSLMNLTVFKETGTSIYEVCNSHTTGYTGAITCNVSQYTGRLKAVVERSASPPRPITSLIAEVITSTWDSNFGIFLVFLITIPIIFVFAFISPIAGIIGGVIALIPAWYLGSVSFAVIAGLTVLGGIVIHFAKRVTR